MQRAIFIAVLALSATNLSAGPCRIYFLDQSNFEQKRGFTLDLEGDSGNQPTCALADMRITFGVADGTSWRYIIVPQQLKAGQLYVLNATIDNTGSQLSLDGVQLGKTGGAFVPVSTPLLVANIPGWAATPIDNWVLVRDVTATNSTGAVSASPVPATLPAPVLLFQQPAGQQVAYTTSADDTQAFTVRFSIVAPPNLQRWVCASLRLAQQLVILLFCGWRSG